MLCEFMRMVAWYSDTDLLGEILTRYKRLGSELAAEPIHWQFEDRFME